MAFITWNQKFSVGISKFDLEHQNLIRILNELHQAMLERRSQSVLGQVLDELVAYTQTHFASEEAEMVRLGYSDLERHRKEPVNLTNQVEAFQRDYHAGKVTVSINLLGFLNDWLVGHIQGSDAQYTKFFQAKGLK